VGTEATVEAMVTTLERGRLRLHLKLPLKLPLRLHSTVDTVLGMAMEDTALDTVLDTAVLDTPDLMVVTDTPPTVPMEVTILARGPLMLRLRTDMEDTAQGMDLGMEATDMAVLDTLVMAVGMGMVLATATTDKKLS
jgi:hypothetical protein